MSLKYFGTDGIRGEYGSAVLNDEIAYRAGRAAVRVAKSECGAKTPVIVVGRDTRASGEALLTAFAKGVAVEGGTLMNLGIAPTPCVAYAASASEAVLACSLTASHNPAKDNGIKFFEGAGVKPSEVLEQALDDAIGEADTEGLSEATAEMQDASYLTAKYADAIIAHFSSDLLAGKRVALDCANGAMSEIAPRVFEALGATVDLVAAKPDGTNINAEVGSEHPESLRGLYSNNDYDLGFAFDGDGDRVILTDELGNRVLGEALLAALVTDAKASGNLKDETLVTTVQSNLGLDAALRESGVQVVRTNVGDKHIVRLMLAEGYQIGGEESGHIVLGEFAVTGDGLFAAVKLSDLVSRLGRPISELTGVYSPFPQDSRAVKVVAKPSLESCPNLSACMEELATDFGGDGRLLVRYSGTEPKLRLLVEAKSDAAVAAAMGKLLAAVREDLDVV